MSKSSSTVTRKGQVTVPIEIRRALGIKEGDQVSFELENGSVRLTRSESYTERTRGAVKAGARPLTAEEMREEAEKAIAEGAIERSGA